MARHCWPKRDTLVPRDETQAFTEAKPARTANIITTLRVRRRASLQKNIFARCAKAAKAISPALVRSAAWLWSGIRLPASGEDHLHLPDASADRAGSSGQLPDLRHGVRAENASRQRRREYGTARHDSAFLDRRAPSTASLPARNGALVAERAGLGAWATFALDAIYLSARRSCCGRLAVFRAGLAFARYAG